MWPDSSHDCAIVFHLSTEGPPCGEGFVLRSGSKEGSCFRLIDCCLTHSRLESNKKEGNLQTWLRRISSPFLPMTCTTCSRRRAALLSFHIKCYAIVLQKSIPRQFRQRVVHYYSFQECVDGFAWALIFAKHWVINFCEMSSSTETENTTNSKNVNVYYDRLLLGDIRPWEGDPSTYFCLVSLPRGRYGRSQPSFYQHWSSRTRQMSSEFGTHRTVKAKLGSELEPLVRKIR